MGVLRVLVVARRFFHRGDDITSAENEIRGQVPRSRPDVDLMSHTGEDASARRARPSSWPPPGVSGPGSGPCRFAVFENRSNPHLLHPWVERDHDAVGVRIPPGSDTVCVGGGPPKGVVSIRSVGRACQRGPTSDTQHLAVWNRVLVEHRPRTCQRVTE